ncbi:DUF3124 domain-containing protein [uncultured Dokdonia sp.]|uniref:DUF3124 domain-containing protein n=1 Tax=uncultured Dokdonia sp. TaxID=575653 RepID=UPI002618D392|nr:DUF3124 domain-containing protein [uncultured Dokdonia sp.]
MKYKIFILIFILLGTFYSCVDKNPNTITEKEIQQENLVKAKNAALTYPINAEVYVPIYSDIYSKNRNTKILLTATLSIRNTSKKDSLFINTIEYYNTEGTLVRNYIKSPIFLKPLETIDYVIEEEDAEGGSGANFLIDWGAKNKITPVFQAVMIGMIGQHAFSFTTDGTTIE